MPLDGDSDEGESGVDRYARPVSKLSFYVGCFLAFFSGFLTMFNNFLIKETGSDFGELIAIRSLLQIAVMLTLSKVMGRRMSIRVTAQVCRMILI